MSEAFVWPQLAERVVDQNPAEARLEAEAAGRAAGYEQGLEEGRQAAAGEAQQHRQRLAASLESLDRQLREYGEQRVDTLAAVVHALCGRVLGHELVSNVEALERVLAEALSRLDADSAAAEVFVNPEDHPAIADIYQGTLALHADPEVPRYGLSVRLPTQAADFQPMTLIDELFEDVGRDRAG